MTPVALNAQADEAMKRAELRRSLPALSPLVEKNLSTMRDPRRTIVIAHANSHSPRAKRWYRIAEACEFDGELFLHRDYIKTPVENFPTNARGTPMNKAAAVAIAKAHAEVSGNPYVPGVHIGHFGYPLKRMG